MEFFGYHKDHEARRDTTAPHTLLRRLTKRS